MADFMRKLELLWGMPVFCKKKGDDSPKHFGSFLAEESPFLYSDKLVRILEEKSDHQELPVIYRDEHNVYFICVRTTDTYYFTGPVCLEEMDYAAVHRYCRFYKVPDSAGSHPAERNMTDILNFAGLLYELLCKKTVSQEALLVGNSLVEIEEAFKEKEAAQLDLRNIEDEAYHHTYQEEQYVMGCVQEGNVQDVLVRMDALVKTAGSLSAKRFNHEKYLAIVSVALATRAAISGGLSPTKAYRISDLYINKIDKCLRIEEFMEYNRKAIFEFTQAVAEEKKRKKASNYTEQCKDYIYKNFHHKISLEQMAAELGVSQGHLSRVFRQNTGMCIQEYIQRFRVERATNLLKYSEASLTEISDYMCFHSQSHFGSVFKRYMHMTPGEYRNQYKQKEFMQDF